MLDFKELGPLLEYLSGLSTQVILAAAALHFLFFFLLWVWYRRDLKVIASTLEDFTRGIKHRSIIGRAAPLGTQIDAFVADIQDVLTDDERVEDRKACLLRLHILDEKRSYLDSLSFETAHNIARTMIEAYPLAGVLGTILAIGSALQRTGDSSAVQSMNTIVSRFGDAIWSTFAGLCAAMLLMFVNSLLETRFERLTDSRTHVRDVVARAKRELGLDASRPKGTSSP
ncbi:MAG: MotA/TolQ/ExbB proton channel family protein [Planctomyces sp.]|nr:MotA/TolQ/ExbB proton channel family protein [Planctomyces sp.]